MVRRPPNYNANELVERIVLACNPGQDPLEGVKMHGSLDDLDPELFEPWVADLREAEKNIRQLRYQLESLRTGRKCATCGGPVVGRSDRAYCSAACRVEMHRGTSPRMQERRAQLREERLRRFEERRQAGDFAHLSHLPGFGDPV